MKKLTALLLLFLLVFSLPTWSQMHDLVKDIEIRRTSFGVPHIKASTLKGVAFGLAFAEMEDYGEQVIPPLIRARGDISLFIGEEGVPSDVINQQAYELAKNSYSDHDSETLELLEGFAEGVNYFIQKNKDLKSKYGHLTFTGLDVAAASTSIASQANARRFLAALERKEFIEDSLAQVNEAGSNVWAFAPEKTKSGNAILVRNPHLRWSAGYYEAHLTVKGTLNFYGDFRIGGLFGIIGGFNENVGWSTTNNSPDTDEIYSFDISPSTPDHFIMDGKEVPLTREMITVEFKNGPGVSLTNQEILKTPFGPVIHRGKGKIYVIKAGSDGETRRCDQFTRMMLSSNFEEWSAAMKMRAISSSNYTYADKDGNIFYVWMASIPNIPHAYVGNEASTHATQSDDIWKDLHPYDKLPQLLNPKGGYLHNENDPFHFTNLNEVLQPEDFPENFPPPRLRQRSQLSIQLIESKGKLSLEDIIQLKHDMTMKVADQMKGDLISLLKETRGTDTFNRAIQVLEDWDNTVAKESKGGVLFASWFWNYRTLMQGNELYAEPWSFDKPMDTPDGIADKNIALEAFVIAIDETLSKYGALDIAWGEVNRARRGDLDLPVGGCTGTLGCFRVLWYTDAEDGKRKIYGGDGWQFAVEFGKRIKAYSILAYGQSSNPQSPHHTDQLKLFTENKMKRVAFYEKEIRKELIESYSPENGRSKF